MHNTNTSTWIIVIVLVIFIVYIYFRNNENFATSTEALNNLASMYNAGTLTATNLRTTGNDSVFNGSVGHQSIAHFGGLGTDTWFPAVDGKNYIRGPLSIDGSVDHTNLAHFGGLGTDTWFPAVDGKNYIRGHLQVDGPTNFTAGLNTTGAANIGTDLTVGGSIGTMSAISGGLIYGKLNTIRIPSQGSNGAISDYIMNGKFFSTTDPPGTTLHFITDGGYHAMATVVDKGTFVTHVQGTGDRRTIL